MRNFLTRLTLAVALLVGVASAPAFAQLTVTQTTLAAAIPAPPQSGSASSTTPTVISLASATGVNVGSELFFDREAVLVTAVNGAANISVQRGYDSTSAAGHLSGTTVFVGPTSVSGIGLTPFGFTDPPSPGTCVATTEVFNFRINVTSGYVWQCVASRWIAAAEVPAIGVQPLGVGADVASATTITPTAGVFRVTGTTAIATINLPVGCQNDGCVITLLPVAAFTTTAAGNIVITSTAVIGKALIMTYSPATLKWYPSY